jgi:hypothetical protein
MVMMVMEMVMVVMTVKMIQAHSTTQTGRPL